MSTRPVNISLDLADVSEIRDMREARASDLPRDQHALMSSWGGPEQARSVYYTSTGGTTTTYYPSARVPPGVTDVGIEILVSGSASILITSAVDAVGSLFTSAVTYADTPTSESATRIYNSGTDSSQGAPGRALTVRSAVAWTWETVQLTLVIDPLSAEDVVIYGLSVVPLHIPR